MIADDPGVVFEMIEQVDHQRALVSKADVSALIHVADVDQDRVGILPPPAPDLASRNAPIHRDPGFRRSRRLAGYDRVNPLCAGSKCKPCRD